jgi:hypothetical protein
MKTPGRHFISCFVLIFLVILAAIFYTVGCVEIIHHPDPLAGWEYDLDDQPDKAIVADYQKYIRKLPPNERNLGQIWFFKKDGTSQHAIRIEIPLNGVWWYHVLIYDKDDKRIEAIKYASGQYRS